ACPQTIKRDSCENPAMPQRQLNPGCTCAVEGVRQTRACGQILPGHCQPAQTGPVPACNKEERPAMTFEKEVSE
ncbi:hypothetical protein, partial [Klebsiella oxytoca]